MLYLCQNTHEHGARFVTVPPFIINRRRLNASNNFVASKLNVIWSVAAILLSSQPFWTAVANTQLFKSKWHGWLLVFLTRRCGLDRGGTRRAGRFTVFKYVEVNSIDRLLDKKFYPTSLVEAVEDLSTVAIVNLVDNNVVRNDDEDNQLNFIDTILDKYSEDHLRGISVLMIECWYTNLDINLEEELVFDNGNIKFELQVICSTHHHAGRNDNPNSFTSQVLCRHGGNNHPSWWYQERNDYIRRHLSSKTDKLVEDGVLVADHSYTLVFCRMQNNDMDLLRDEYLNYLGGQSKCKCNHHRLSLVRSMEKTLKCSRCNDRFEFYKCPAANCKCCICNRCLQQLDLDTDNTPIQFITSHSNNDHDDSDNEPSILSTGSMTMPLMQSGNDNDYHNDSSNESYCGSDSNDEDDSLEIPYYIEDGDHLLHGKIIIIVLHHHRQVNLILQQLSLFIYSSFCC